MIMSVTLTRDMNDYYKAKNLDIIVATLLQRYDITTLPQVTGEGRYVRKVEVKDPAYIALCGFYGTKSPKVSLSRLLFFGMCQDVCATLSAEELRLPSEDTLSVLQSVLAFLDKVPRSPRIEQLYKLVGEEIEACR